MMYLNCSFHILNAVSVCYIIKISKFGIFKNCKSILKTFRYSLGRMIMQIEYIFFKF